MRPSSEKVVERILQSSDLPTLPVIASKLLDLTAREDTTLTDIASLISRDVALSSKMLKVANSSFYSFPHQISTINQAVSILGTNTVRSLALSFSFLSLDGKKKRSNFDFKTFWEKSLVSAAAAKLILAQIEDADPDEIFISGLLINIGKLILATTMPEEYNKYLTARKEDRDTDALTLEEEILGINHPDIGFAAAKKWGFPESLLMPIKHHHNPEDCSVVNKHLKQNIAAVHLASLLTGIYYSDDPNSYHTEFHKKARKLLGLKKTSINAILLHVNHDIKDAARFFNVKIGSVKSIAEILQEANLRLTLLNLSYEEMNRELVKAKMELEKLAAELEHKNTVLENLANIDELTEINNHRFFQNYLDNEINRSIRTQRPISLLLADIDHFKQFNDTYGHQTGDFILKGFCRVARDNIREYDLIARYGGEEFIFVLPETDSNQAMAIAEKLCKVTAGYPFNDGTRTYSVTISIGVATAQPDGNTFKKNEFIGLADEAMYEAKKKGRNRVALYKQKKKSKWFS